MKKMIISLVMASIFSLVLVGCGKDAAAESAPETKVEEEQTVIESTEESSEAAKLSKIQTDVSSPIGEDISEEPAAEDSEEPIVESSVEDSEYVGFDYDDPSSVDYRAFCTGDLFEIDDYCVALGYDVALGEEGHQESCFYNLTRYDGIRISIHNYNYMMSVMYQDYEADRIYIANLDWYGFSDGVDNMVVRSVNHESHDMSEKWCSEIAAALKYIATTDSFNIDEIPYSNYMVIIQEGAGVYTPSGIFYVPENSVEITEYTVNN